MKQGTLASYIVGFAASLILTLAAFFAVVYPGLLHADGGTILTVILTLAVLQLIVQVLFFLHLGTSSGKGSELLAFAFTLTLVIILVVASLWIMNHLNYNMTPTQINQYMQNEQGGF